MNIVVAIDSLKESLTSTEAGEAVRAGIIAAYPEAKIFVSPLADGGEGTTEALTIGMGGTSERVSVTNPLGRKIDAAYGILPNGTAVMEMAAAAGIALISPHERNPLLTTTYGVGEMIRHAVEKGCRRFIVGIGGSATNDGGAGMLQALGFQLLTANGQDISRGAQGLRDLATIKTENVMPELDQCEFRIACDVTNPLCGANGCSVVFAPQKGATLDMICQMDRWLANYAALSQKTFSHASPDFPGAGAAGGLGFAFLAYTHASLASGVKIVLEETKLEEYIKNADLVITGEGRLDAQTIMGKAPIGVAKIAKKYGKPVLAFAGSVTADAKECNAHGIDAFFPILRRVSTLEEALSKKNAAENMRDTAEQVMRLICAGVKITSEARG